MKGCLVNFAAYLICYEHVFGAEAGERGSLLCYEVNEKNSYYNHPHNGSGTNMVRTILHAVFQTGLPV